VSFNLPVVFRLPSRTNTISHSSSRSPLGWLKLLQYWTCHLAAVLSRVLTLVFYRKFIIPGFYESHESPTNIQRLPFTETWNRAASAPENIEICPSYRVAYWWPSFGPPFIGFHTNDILTIRCQRGFILLNSLGLNRRHRSGVEPGRSEKWLRYFFNSRIEVLQSLVWQIQIWTSFQGVR